MFSVNKLYMEQGRCEQNKTEKKGNKRERLRKSEAEGTKKKKSLFSRQGDRLWGAGGVTEQVHCCIKYSMDSSHNKVQAI